MPNKIDLLPDRKQFIVVIMIVIVILAVYGQVHHHDFVNIDDNLYVTENNHVQSGLTWNAFRWAFSIKSVGWDPLTFISLMFDYDLYGIKAGGYHLTNLIFHILSSLLLFFLFHRMTKDIWKSAFVAAFFALHPLHVESVAWIAERKDVLSVFFWMLTLCLYIDYTKKPAIKRYLLVLASFSCALMSKPMVITLPVIMILLDYWPLKRLESRKANLFLWQLQEKAPFFVLSAFFSILTIYLTTTSPVQSYVFPLIAYMANAPVAFVTYMGQTFWPYDLSVIYLFPVNIPAWKIIGATILIIMITTAVIIALKCTPSLFVGWLWFVITIAPVIGIIPFASYAMADRYHYLPSIGVAVMLAWGIPLSFKNEKTGIKVLIPAAIVFIIIMSLLSWQQCKYWRTSVTLFNHSLQIAENNVLAQTNLASALHEEGRGAEAISIYNRLIHLRPHVAEFYYNRGNVYADQRQYAKAIEDYNQAIRFNTEYLDAYNNRGTVFEAIGQYQKAIEDCSMAIRINPDYIAYFNRGNNYNRIGRYELALKDFNQAINMKPDFADAYSNRGAAYFYQGKNKEGCRDARTACTLGNCNLIRAVKDQGICSETR